MPLGTQGYYRGLIGNKPRATKANYNPLLNPGFGGYFTNPGGKLAPWQQVPGHLYDPYAGIQEDPNQPGTPAYEQRQAQILAAGKARQSTLAQANPGGYAGPLGVAAPQGSPTGTYFNPIQNQWQVPGNVGAGTQAHPLFQTPTAAAPMNPLDAWQAAGSPNLAWNGQTNPNAVANPWTPPKRAINYMPGHGPLGPPGISWGGAYANQGT